MGEQYMLFFEAFEQLTCDSELRNLYSETEVVRVVASKQNNTLVIHIKSKVLILRDNIKRMEELLNRQLFSNTGNKAIIAPYFELAEKYELGNLLSVYRDSILEELKDISVVTYYLLTQADIRIKGNTIIIKSKENCVAEDKFDKLRVYLIKLFEERFGYDIFVKFEYIKPKEKRKLRLPAFLRPEEDEDDDDDNQDEEYEAPPYDYYDGGFYGAENDGVGNEEGNNGTGYNGAEINRAAENGVGNSNNSNSDMNGSIRITNGSANHNSIRSTNDSANDNNNIISVNGSVKIPNIRSANSSATDNSIKSTNGSANNYNKKSTNSKKSTYEKGKNNFRRLPKDPSVIYGKNFEGSLIPISDIIGEIGEVFIRGKVRKLENRPIGNEKSLITFVLTDLIDSIKVKIYSKTIEVDEILDSLKEGSFYTLKGIAMADSYERDITIGSVVGIKAIENFTAKRYDKAPMKRVELHAHTMMSDMDAVVDVQKLVRRAFDWGHPAVAITDHGVVQSFPQANHTINPKSFSDPEDKARAEKFKVIFGMEAYLVDDIKEVVTNGKGQSLSEDDFVVFDIETTGFSKVNDRIIEIGAVKVSKGEIIGRFSTFVNPKIPIPYKITQLTSITDEMVVNAPAIEDALLDFLEFSKGTVLVAHNASFDMGFLSNLVWQMNLHI
jgi:DNA polymerase-3 subunit alpha (Gram-positive type)